MTAAADTIAAIATPAGRGAIGIVRVSGPASRAIAARIAGGAEPVARRASLRPFTAADGSLLDRGIVLFFPGPGSYTGEDMLELHGHGGALITDLVLRRVLELGARPARPGEFTERAWLNGRLDLLQAEAVADLIDSQSERAARCAARALDGEFSRRVGVLQQDLTALRAHVEAALDFPDEELPLPERQTLRAAAARWLESVESLRAAARAGHALRAGLRVVIAGAPNVGKSSLLNRLVGTERAIVDDTPGTTRDIVEGELVLGGMRIAVLDTAGVRDAGDSVEREGVRRAVQALEQADVVLVVRDTDNADMAPELAQRVAAARRRVFVRNKIDRDGLPPRARADEGDWDVALSARTGAGIDLLLRVLEEHAGGSDGTEDMLLARTRHLHALDAVAEAAARALSALDRGAAPELAAEDLRAAQASLGRITGAVGADDLLGEIFSRFCIGK
jgi:tRNA modification GTPase